MSPLIIILFVLGYFAVLLSFSFFTGKEDSNEAFFSGNKQSPWYIVAFGMIGASLSGVTFISVPGWVATSQFSYMQMVLGYLVGYTVIATVLMPLYYRLNLVTIYGYLKTRFGNNAYQTGSAYFLISRLIGASFRLYLVAIVFQYGIFDKLEMQVPFFVTVVITILLIWLYTFRSGIKTIIWTDTLQTTFMLLAVILTIYFIAQNLDFTMGELFQTIHQSDYSQIFFFEDIKDSRHFVKQFLGGAFIAIVMTGLDQDMMQKNLSCKNIKDAQKNMFWFSIVLVFVNLLFLALGALLYIFAHLKGIALPEKADQLYPMIAMDGYLGFGVSVLFILGLVAAAYSSADSALTALTTAVCVDFIRIEEKPKEKQSTIRKRVHIVISIIVILVILLFKVINEESVINELFKIAGYTYGPLLGLFAFGLFTKIEIKDKWVYVVCVLSPILSYLINIKSEFLFWGYRFGFELLILNGALTFLGLYLIKRSQPIQHNALHP
jgi:solute:Na+ symporter, SSS family